MKGKLYRHWDDRVIFHLFVHFLNDCNCQSWTRLYSGAKREEIFLDLPCGLKGPSTWVIFCCFPQCISRMLNRKWSGQDLCWHAYGMFVSQAVSFNHYAHTRHRNTLSYCVYQVCFHYLSSYISKQDAFTFTFCFFKKS